jgi:energy-coupling factor transport system ATP-binding protein
MKPDELKAMNLTVPMTVELAHRLRKRGIDVPKEIITMEEMVEYLCQYK